MLKGNSTKGRDNDVEEHSQRHANQEPHFVGFHHHCLFDLGALLLEDHTVTTSLSSLVHQTVKLLFSFQEELHVSSQHTFEIFHLCQQVIDLGILHQVGPIDIVMVHRGSHHGLEIFVQAVGIGIAYPAFAVSSSKVVRQCLEKGEIDLLFSGIAIVAQAAVKDFVLVPQMKEMFLDRSHIQFLGRIDRHRTRLQKLAEEVVFARPIVAMTKGLQIAFLHNGGVVSQVFQERRGDLGCVARESFRRKLAQNGSIFRTANDGVHNHGLSVM